METKSQQPLAIDDSVLQAVDASRCKEHFDAAVKFAKENDRWLGPNGLHANLQRLVAIGRTEKPVLFKDFAPYSFEFAAGGFQGGLIFHGKHDAGGNGDAPTFSVSLTPIDGWSLHT
jgi:Domain of unknown function (DUF4120)